MEHSNKNINERVAIAIEDLCDLKFDGCIAGSCLLPNDFSKWDTEPDVDFFAYSEVSWLYAIANIMSKDRYIAGSQKDEWKLSRIAQGKHKSTRKFVTQTIYIYDTETGICLNLSYKPGTQNALDVLSRFDTIAIMIGRCCRTNTLIDLRGSFFYPESTLVQGIDGRANPIRLWYMTEGWDEETWSRELARINKYKSRGFLMRGMAVDLLEVAARVLDKGDVVGSEKSKARYLNLLLSCYRPVLWLEDFIFPNKEEGGDMLSQNIFSEILKLTKDLPIELSKNMLDGLSIPLVPEGDKQFIPGFDGEEELDEEQVDDR